MTERIEWVADPSRFAELEGPWDGLAARASAPFARHGWLSAWWEAFGAGGEMRVCALWRGSDLAGGLPLWASAGSLRAMANIHTPRFDAPALDADARDALARAAIEAAPGAFEVVALETPGPLLEALATRARHERRRVLVEPWLTSPVVELEGDFESYRRRTRPKWLGRILAYRRKVARDHVAEFSVLEPPADLERQLEEGLRLEASGWKGRAGTAILASEETARFYRSMARAFDRLGELRMSSLHLDGDLVAFDISLLHDDRVWFLKTAFDERFRRVSPGLVLLASVIERAFELGLDAVELLGGSEDYKTSFATSAREHRAIRVYRHRPVALARYAYRRRVRPALRRGYHLARRTRG